MHVILIFVVDCYRIIIYYILLCTIVGTCRYVTEVRFVPSVQASMTKNALEDLTTSLHYSDYWDVMGIEAINYQSTIDDRRE